MRVVFARDPARIHLDLMPLTLRKQAAIKNPRLLTTGAFGALGVAIAATALRRFKP